MASRFPYPYIHVSNTYPFMSQFAGSTVSHSVLSDLSRSPENTNCISSSSDRRNSSGSNNIRLYQRRNRTKFTPEQIDELEKAFKKTQYPDALTREELAERLQISESKIQVSSDYDHFLLIDAILGKLTELPFEYFKRSP